MRTLPAGMAASLASGVTTFCHCWRLVRNDGVVLGFTDHDRDLTFGGVTYKAESGLSASAWSASLGLAVDTLDAFGALSSDALTDDDLAQGLWDGAVFTLFLVDWSQVADRDVVLAGSIGEVSRGPLAFRAEARSLSYALNQPEGRIFSALCDADLGDERCTVDLDDPAYREDATVASVTSRSAFRSMLGFEAHWCSRGKVTWTSGANEGAAMEVKRHIIVGGEAVIELVDDMAFDIAVGDDFTITAGCDKASKTCFGKFDNILNQRGFPFMPGNDWVTSYPNQGEGNDGGALG